MRLLAMTLLPWLAVPTAWADGGSDPASSSADRVDQILAALKKRSDGLTDIRCKVEFIEYDRINLTTGRKSGRILFLITEPNPVFLIHFERGDRDGVIQKQEWYLFDGRWLHQAIERIKQVTKQEIARPGEKVDLFDLERAPFPLPFGQKKDKILANFDVTLIPPQPDDPADTDHLLCLPKPDSRMHGKYEKLEFYVHRNLHLPTRVVITKNEGLEVTRADFTDLTADSINTGVTKSDFARPKAWKKYKEVVEQLPPATGSNP